MLTMAFSNSLYCTVPVKPTAAVLHCTHEVIARMSSDGRECSQLSDSANWKTRSYRCTGLSHTYQLQVKQIPKGTVV